MSPRAPARRRYAVKFWLRTDDPLELLVYDALKSLSDTGTRGLAGVSWKLNILGLFAACGDDPRPLATRLGLRKVSAIEGIRPLLRIYEKGSPDDDPVATVVAGTPLQSTAARQDVVAPQPTAELTSDSAGERKESPKSSARSFDLEQFLRLGQAEDGA